MLSVQYPEIPRDCGNPKGLWVYRCGRPERQRESPKYTRRWCCGFLRSNRIFFEKKDFQTVSVQGSDTTHRLSSTKSKHLAPGAPDCRTNPRDTASVQSVLGVGAVGSGAIPVSYTKIQIFKPAPFRGPTPRIASPGRDLAIRGVEDTIRPPPGRTKQYRTK